MTTKQTFADFIKGASTLERHKFADALEAAAPNMSLSELKPLVAALSEYVNAQSAKTDSKARRLAKIDASLRSDNPKDKINVKTALRGMQRLGLDLDTIAASADVKAVEKAMTEQKWTDLERIQLKTVLANLGVIG
jgi:hypothetical protein